MIRLTIRLPCIVFVALLTLTYGCNFAPVHERPRVSIPPHVGKTVSDPGGVDEELPRTWHDALVDWNTLHSDPRLARLLKLTLANNQDLRLAALHAQKVQANYQIQRRSRFPAVEGTVTQTRQRPDADNDLATLGIGITSYELDLFGRLSNLRDSALSMYFSALASQEAARISLVAAVIGADLSVMANELELVILQQMRNDSHRSVRLTRLLYEEGSTTREDLLRREAEGEELRESIALQERQLQQSRADLLLLLGLPELPDTLAPPAPQTWQDKLPDMPDPPAGLPSDLLLRRPDIIAAEQQLKASHANIGAARAAFFPRIALTASFGRASTSLSALFDNTTKAWTFVPQVSIPIFDAGLNRANLAVAETERQLAITQYEKAVKTAFQEVSVALASASSLQRALNANEGKLRALEQAYQLATTRWKNGSISAFEHLGTRKALLDAHLGKVRLQLQAALNRITLYKALGGSGRKPLARSATAQAPVICCRERPVAATGATPIARSHPHR